MLIQDLLKMISKEEVTEAENPQIVAIKKQIADVNAQIEDIVENGGKVSLTDPLNVKLNQLRRKMKTLKKPTIKEERSEEVGDALDKFMDANKLYNFEGESGVRKFQKITSALGYRDLDAFLADNSGCFEVMIEWIKDQRIPEWIEGLGGEEE